MKESLIRADAFSDLCWEDHLPGPPALGFCPADSVFPLPSPDNDLFVLAESPGCCWPHPEEHLPPHPSGECPVGNPALILSSIRLL